jgi:hypothetical protein
MRWCLILQVSYDLFPFYISTTFLVSYNLFCTGRVTQNHSYFKPSLPETELVRRAIIAWHTVASSTGSRMQRGRLSLWPRWGFLWQTAANRKCTRLGWFPQAKAGWSVKGTDVKSGVVNSSCTQQIKHWFLNQQQWRHSCTANIYRLSISKRVTGIFPKG